MTRRPEPSEQTILGDRPRFEGGPARGLSQNPHALRVGLAKLLRHPANQVRVRCGDIGGAFGQKGYLTREDVAVAAAAKTLGRPVKWIEDRYENLASGGHARDERLDVEAAVDADGVVEALRVRRTPDQGAYPMSGFAVPAITNLIRVLLPAAYRISAVDFQASVVATNKGTYVAYRGRWEAETWVRERLLDLIGRDLGIDPVEVRRRNLWRDDELPTRMSRTLWTSRRSKSITSTLLRWPRSGSGVLERVEPSALPPQ